MNARNIVTRILIDEDAAVENEFDCCIIETILGDVFVLLCAPINEKPNVYRATIYKTAIYVKGGDKDSNADFVARVINMMQPVYTYSFYAPTPFIKRGTVSTMLESVKHDDANTWDNLKKDFGNEDVSNLYGCYGQAGFC